MTDSIEVGDLVETRTFIMHEPIICLVIADHSANKDFVGCEFECYDFNRQKSIFRFTNECRLLVKRFNMLM